MDVESFRSYCLAKPGATEGTPFGPGTLVFKVMGKMFALADLDGPRGVNLKCEPERAIELREQYDAITPGHHMNKRHWNTISMDGRVKDKLLRELIDHSYALVSASLPKELRNRPS